MSYPTTLNATPQIPPLLGGLVAILMLIWGVSHLSDGASSLSTPPMAPPRELPADATGVFRPFPGQLQEPIIILANLPKINRQKQDGHIGGTPQHINRTKQGTPTSTWLPNVDADQLTIDTWQNGKVISVNIQTKGLIKELDYGKQIGTDPQGNPVTKVRVTQDNSKGEIHGRPE